MMDCGFLRASSISKTVCCWYTFGPLKTTQPVPHARRRALAAVRVETGSPKNHGAITKVMTIFQQLMAAKILCGASPRATQQTKLPMIHISPPRSHRLCIQYGRDGAP